MRVVTLVASISLRSADPTTQILEGGSIGNGECLVALGSQTLSIYSSYTIWNRQSIFAALFTLCTATMHLRRTLLPWSFDPLSVIYSAHTFYHQPYLFCLLTPSSPIHAVINKDVAHQRPVDEFFDGWLARHQQIGYGTVHSEISF